MSRARRRWLSLVATIALVVSMMPVGPASGAGTTGADGAAWSAEAATTNFEPFPEVAGTVTEPLTSKMAAQRASTEVPAAEDYPYSELAASLFDSVHTASVQASALSTNVGSQNTTTAVSGTWSGTVFVRGDVVVPAGKTLTILPGTAVYFDTVSSETTTTHDVYSGDPTGGIDVIVHGKLVAAGTSTAPVTLASVASLPASASVGISAGPVGVWGKVFFDSKSASVLSRCRIDAGAGIVAYRTLRPYVTDCSITNVGDPFFGPTTAVHFINPPKGDSTTPRAQVLRNTITSAYGVEFEWDPMAGQTATCSIDPLVSGNHMIVSGFGMGFFAHDDAENGTATPAGYSVAGAVSTNRIDTSWGAEAIACEVDGNAPVAVTTEYSGNVLGSAEGSTGFVSFIDTVGRPLSFAPRFTGDTIKSGSEGVLMFNQVQSDEPEILRVSAASLSAPLVCAPKFTNTAINAGGQAVFALASNATTATVTCAPSFYGGSARVIGGKGPKSLGGGGGPGVITSVAQGNGSAASTPVLTGVTVDGGASPFAGVAAQAGAALKANAKPTITACQLNVPFGMMGISVDAQANGIAESSPVVDDTLIHSAGTAFAAYASSASGASARVGGLLHDTYVHGGTAIDAMATNEGTGTATVDTRLVGCDLLSLDYGWNTRAVTMAGDGAAVSSPSLLGCNMWGAGGMNAMSVPNAMGGSGVKACAPIIKDSSIVSQMYPLGIIASNMSQGSATARPTVMSSDLLATAGEGVIFQAGVSASGTADVSPVIDDSAISAVSSAVQLEVPGNVTENEDIGGTIGGSISDTTIEGGVEPAFVASVRGMGRGATLNTTFVDSAIEGGFGPAVLASVNGSGTVGTTFKAAPTFSGCSISGQYVGVDVSAYESGLFGADYQVAPRFSNTIVSGGVDTSARCAGSGDAKNSTYFSGGSLLHGGLSADAECDEVMILAGESGSGTATVDAQVFGTTTRKVPVQDTSGSGVEMRATSDQGKAICQGRAQYLNIKAAYSGVAAFADAPYGTASNTSVVRNNVISDEFGLEGVGVDVQAWAPAYQFTPDISSNSVTRAGRDGIVAEAGSPEAFSAPALVPVSSTFAPVVSGNAVFAPRVFGIFVASGLDALGTPKVVRNSVAKSGASAVFMGNESGLVEQNKLTEPGLRPVFEETRMSAARSSGAGIDWYYADPATALVRGNMITGSNHAAVSYTYGAPTTMWNSFANTAGVGNSPFDYEQFDDATSTVTPYNARSNWWGSTSSVDVSASVFTPAYLGDKADIVNFSNQLTNVRPTVTYIGATKTSTKVAFTVKFDRPMDTAIKTLKFGKSSPYSTYGVTGTWSKDASGNYTIWKGTRSRTGLPTGVNLYFSGAKDLPGTGMLSTSKAFKL